MPNTSFTDLEIRLLQKLPEGGYPIEITLGGQQEFPRGHLSPEVLSWLSSGELAADGQRLFNALLADAPVREAWGQGYWLSTSISGNYGLVYGTVLTDTADPWKVYAIGVPAWVNDLASLSFAQSYWISVTRSITLDVTSGAAALARLDNLPSPPMTVYGTAPAGGTVTAWIGGVQCGQGATEMISNQLVYTLNIQPDAPSGKTDCGAAGRVVTFKIGAQAMSTSLGWDIDWVWNAPLTP